ncbi:MAG TPA: hypothetical protein VFV40_11015 [Nocardioides sp.]|nr:hypothetical protein [Nocardioides sp.]
MSGWERRLLDVFDDLEQQAEGLALAERDARVADLARAEYGEVDLLSRLHAGVGRLLTLSVIGLGRLRGTAARVGADWLMVDDGVHEWLVRLAALEEVRGLPDRAVGTQGRAVTARLGLGSVLRSVAADAVPVVVHGTTGRVQRARLGRVGADFVELDTADADASGGDLPDPGPTVVPWGVIAAVRRA